MYRRNNQGLDGFYHASQRKQKRQEEGKDEDDCILRLSGRKQVGGSDFDRQLERIKKYYAAEKWEIDS